LSAIRAKARLQEIDQTSKPRRRADPRLSVYYYLDFTVLKYAAG